MKKANLRKDHFRNMIYKSSFLELDFCVDYLLVFKNQWLSLA